MSIPLNILEFERKRVYSDPSAKLWVDFTRKSGGKNLIDTGEFEYPNLLTGHTFEPTNLCTWSKTGDQTGNWTPIKSTEADETSIVKNCTHSYKLTVDDAGGTGWSYAYQTVSGHEALRGLPVTLGGWVRCNSTNDEDTTLRVYDGVDSTNSSVVAKDDVFHWTVVTHILNAAASTLQAVLRVKGNNNAEADDVSYFDGVILVQASSLTPTGWTLYGTGAVCHYDFYSKIGTYSCALERNSNNCQVYQDYTGESPNTDYIAGVWCYHDGTANADDTVCGMYDGVANGDNPAGYGHTTNAGWEFLVNTITTDASADRVRVYMNLDNTDSYVYFDSPALVEGSSLTPGWTGVNAEIAPTGDEYKIGSYSMRVVNDGVYGRAKYVVPGHVGLRGKTLTLAAWGQASSANSGAAVKLGMDDGVDTTVMATALAEDDAWHWMTHSHTVNAASTTLEARCASYYDGGATTGEIAYFDGIKLYKEAGIIDGVRGTPINIMGGVLTPEGLVLDGVDDYVWITNADMKKAGLDFTTENFSIFVRGEWEATTAIQTIISTRDDTDGKGYELVLSATEELEFNTYGASDISTDSAAGAITGTEKATLSMSRDKVAVVNLHKNGNSVTDTAGTHVALTSSDEPFVIGAKADDKTLPSKATIKSVLFLSRPTGAVEHPEIAREMEVICP